MSKPRIDRLIIVEGKYDKIRLENIVDASIIAVDGFRIFRDKDLQRTVVQLSLGGAVILTDSDTAGYRIRVFLSSLLRDRNVTHIFLPQIPGKERRKERASAEGFLGVEGIEDAVILEKLSAVTCDRPERQEGISTATLYALGYIGCAGAKERRNALLSRLEIQKNVSNTFLLRILNDRFTPEQFACLQISEK